MKSTLIFLLIAFLTPIGSVQAEPVVQEVMEKAGPILGEEFLVFIVTSEGAIADTTFIALSVSKPSAVAKQLAKVVKAAKRKPVNIAVSGPNSKKAAVVIIDAMEINSKRVLSKLRLVFVGNESNSPKVKAAVEKVGGAYFFAQSDI